MYAVIARFHGNALAPRVAIGMVDQLVVHRELLTLRECVHINKGASPEREAARKPSALIICSCVVTTTLNIDQVKVSVPFVVRTRVVIGLNRSNDMLITVWFVINE